MLRVRIWIEDEEGSQESRCVYAVTVPFTVGPHIARDIAMAVSEAAATLLKSIAADIRREWSE